MTNSDRRTNEQAIAVARGQAELPTFFGDGKTRWQEIRDAYSQAAVALDATGQPEDRTLARDVRGFLDTHPDLNATPEIFAAHHARILAAVRAKRASQRLADTTLQRGYAVLGARASRPNKRPAPSSWVAL